MPLHGEVAITKVVRRLHNESVNFLTLNNANNSIYFRLTREMKGAEVAQ